MGYVLTKRAMDIETSEQELCYILGYLAAPGRIKYIEAQVPYGKEHMFTNAYPGANYDEMKILLINRVSNLELFLTIMEIVQ